MELVSKIQLSPLERDGLKELLIKCQSWESLSISFPEDAELYLLLRDGPEVLSALSLFQIEKSLWECSAFTRPDMRRRGYFTRLLDVAADQLGEETDICFVTDHRSRDAMAALTALECRYWYSEHMMEMSLNNYCPPASQNTAARIEKGGQSYYILFDEKTIGSVNIAPLKDEVYLYGLEIQEDYRGKGLGGYFFRQVLTALKASGTSTVRLQVSGQNEKAFFLYQKTGFQITETLSYYLY